MKKNKTAQKLNSGVHLLFFFFWLVDGGTICIFTKNENKNSDNNHKGIQTFRSVYELGLESHIFESIVQLFLEEMSENK